MQLGIELITLAPLTLAPATWFELFFSVGHQLVSESFGKDEYLYAIVLPRHARVAATGRKCLFLNHQKAPAADYQAGPAEPVDFAPAEQGAHLLLFVASSLKLTPRQLAREFCLTLVTPGAELRVPLTEEAVEHSGNGKFVIDFSVLLAQVSLPSRLEPLRALAANGLSICQPQSRCERNTAAPMPAASAMRPTGSA
ncbi:MAG TPA: hypothetical protein GX511_01665 [Firmicutes bacterium]|nr:hypothetical protein [Bacillota bacterium]